MYSFFIPISLNENVDVYFLQNVVFLSSVSYQVAKFLHRNKGFFKTRLPSIVLCHPLAKTYIMAEFTGYRPYALG